MLTRHPAFLVVLSLLALVGCGGTSTPADDCASDPTKCACASDATCASPNPRCDSGTGKCVPCLPTADNCPVGKHCVASAGTYACVAQSACNVAADCPIDNRAGLCCTGACADPLNDNNNCGACGNHCGDVANGTGGCVNGVCGVASCSAGFGDCDKKGANGCESNTATDTLHCGNCDTTCKAAPNSKVSCAAGACAFDCLADYADCDGNPVNGCETSTTTNPKACGGCGKVCAKLPNTVDVACVSSACVVATCAGSFSDCNHMAADGCESDIKSDPDNCSGCGRKCPAVMNGQAGCSGASCGIGKCNANFADCDGNVLNGCEQDLTADPKNCGACGKTCIVANGIASCQGGMCVLQACSQGFADCDMDPNNGCEMNTRNDLKNCGQCGVACPVPANATASCSQGVCAVGSCMYGFGDCNNSVNDGCETNILTPVNCGACGKACAAVPNGVSACPAAACSVGSCNMGFADCDKQLANGCEKNLATDPLSCGACGVTCTYPNGVGACAASVCSLASCNNGFADCNVKAVDGCEQDIAGDSKNCGACGKACPVVGATCVAGVCGCPGAKPLVCNNTCVDSAVDAKNCGACGVVCPQNLPTCQAGACTAQTCLNNPQWQAVNCSTGEWVWSRDRALAMDVATANAKHVLATATAGGAQALCSLDGKGYISVQTFVMSGCDAKWYHIGGRYTGNCGGHDGELWRHLVVGANDCYPY